MTLRCYEDNHAYVRSTSRDHRGGDSTSLRRHGRHGRHGRHAVREADSDSPGLEWSGAYRHGHDNDGDDGGLFALHARRFYTDWGTVRSRHANCSRERESRGRYLARRKDVKSDRVQSGMGRFIDRSRNLRLRVVPIKASKISNRKRTQKASQISHFTYKRRPANFD